MNGVLQSGAWIATILGGLSVLAGVVVWIWKQFGEWRERRRIRRHRDWHGYIDVGGVSSWHVRLVDAPDAPAGQVVLDVLSKPDGAPDLNRAHSLRQQIIGDGILARVPTPDEDDFLKALGRERGRGNDPEGFPLR
ncbi:hypothetical protein [Amycolatopsis sp. lyj-108]|uniref:hypothetical protein n=1 Tax=Amycolatopsis sp. lyj-108 TaxID=2789286 RepID=UPI00397C9A0F